MEYRIRREDGEELHAEVRCGRRRPRAPDPGEGERLGRKLRPVVPDQLPDNLRSRRASASRSTRCPAARLLRHVQGEAAVDGRPRGGSGTTRLRKLFSTEQRAFFEAHARRHRARRSRRPGLDLRPEARFTPEEFGRRMVAELWLYPDGSRIVELSTKCAPSEAFQVAAEARAFLTGEASTRRRAADEDEDGARVLLPGARGRRRRVMPDMRTIVVGYDGEEPAARALDRAIDEAQRSDSRLVVVAVSEMPFNPEGPQNFGDARRHSGPHDPAGGATRARAGLRRSTGADRGGRSGRRLLLGRRGAGATRSSARPAIAARRRRRARIAPPRSPLAPARNGRRSRGQALGRL